MSQEEIRVSFFKPFDFEKGQRINITSGPRKGDWEVIDVSKRKVRLKCPISHKEFEWNRFCYLVDEKKVNQWPTS
jgi:hypothetical protein